MNLNKETKIVIISHFSFKDIGKGAVFPHSIRNFLLNKIGTLTYIDHPFPSSNFPASQITIYKQGTKTDQLTTPKIELPILILFTYQLFLTFFFLLKKPIKYDLCIACDNLSLVAVYIFRKLGLIKRIIYYTVDYSPKRYNNPLLNYLYQSIDRLACKISDSNWVAVENMITAKAQNGLNIKESAPFQVVPIGFNAEEITIKSISEVDKFNLVFIGVLYEKQGIQLAINTLPKLIKKFPKIHLTILGSGPFESQIKTLIKDQDISSHTTFTGYIEDHAQIIKILSNCGIGLATYIPSLADYSYFADPSKIKLYLLCGLPVITTPVPPIAKKISRKKAGIIIEYNEQNLYEALEYLLSNPKIYAKYRENALKMARDFDINIILNNAFKKLP